MPLRDKLSKRRWGQIQFVNDNLHHFSDIFLFSSEKIVFRILGAGIRNFRDASRGRPKKRSQVMFFPTFSFIYCARAGFLCTGEVLVIPCESTHAEPDMRRKTPTHICRVAPCKPSPYINHQAIRRVESSGSQIHVTLCPHGGWGVWWGIINRKSGLIVTAGCLAVGANAVRPWSHGTWAG